MRRKSFLALAKTQLIVWILLFLPAWSVRYWEAWVYWALLSVLMVASTIYFLRRAPDLLQRRLRGGPKAETDPNQKIIIAAVILLFCLVFVVAGLDHRFKWSSVSQGAIFTSDCLVVVGYLIMHLALSENSFAASTVQVEVDQPVISTGPYAYARHPMYSGAVLMFAVTPLALGSFWSLPAALALCVVIVVRLLHEERYLSQNLTGYKAYRQRVPYRLIPLIW